MKTTMMAFGLSLLAAAAGAPALAAAQDLRLAPTSRWQVDFADDHCAIQRAFGDGERSVVLELEQDLPGHVFQVTLLAQRLDRRGRSFSTGFVPGAELETQDRHSRLELDGGWEGYRYPDAYLGEDGAFAVDAAREAAIEGYRVEGGFAEDVLLETGPMGEVMQVMRDCLSDLVRGLGFDPAEQATLSRRPVWDYASFDFAQYERQARTVEREYDLETFDALMLVDATGAPYECRADDVPEPARRANAACDYLLANLRFAPALDAAGNPVASYFHFAVRRERITTYSPG